MRVSVAGASGEVGRAVAVQLLLGGLVGPSDGLQLVGHGASGLERKVLAECVDLLDAFHESAPEIEVCSGPEEIDADVVVMAAGVTITDKMRTRNDIAAANRSVFEEFASEISKHGTGRELVVVVSNPVELGVEIFCRHLERHRVLGMGAQQDSLRFARAIATSIGVSRDRVHAWVLGEHGATQVPLWSSVRLLGMSPEEAKAHLSRIRETGIPDDEERRDYVKYAFELMAEERIGEAFEFVESLPPDMRVKIEPFVTHHCLHSTPNATANATCDLVRALRSGRESVVAAQVRLEGEFRGYETVVGLPVLADAAGWSTVVPPALSNEEAGELDASAEAISSNLAEWTA